MEQMPAAGQGHGFLKKITMKNMLLAVIIIITITIILDKTITVKII